MIESPCRAFRRRRPRAIVVQNIQCVMPVFDGDECEEPKWTFCWPLRLLGKLFLPQKIVENRHYVDFFVKFVEEDRCDVAIDERGEQVNHTVRMDADVQE